VDERRILERLTVHARKPEARAAEPRPLARTSGLTLTVDGKEPALSSTHGAETVASRYGAASLGMTQRCEQCDASLTEIDHYGELIGCITCNRWRWRET
jgi:hypothetical protein